MGVGSPQIQISSMFRYARIHARFACLQIIMSVDPPRDASLNWLPMEVGATKIVVRQTFLARPWRQRQMCALSGWWMRRQREAGCSQ